MVVVVVVVVVEVVEVVEVVVATKGKLLREASSTSVAPEEFVTPVRSPEENRQ